MATDGEVALQYSTTKGYLPLRKYIATRYAQKGLQISPVNLLIANGSQQGLDLLGKAFLDEENILERPVI